MFGHVVSGTAFQRPQESLKDERVQHPLSPGSPSTRDGLWRPLARYCLFGGQERILALGRRPAELRVAPERAAVLRSAVPRAGGGFRGSPSPRLDRRHRRAHPSGGGIGAPVRAAQYEVSNCENTSIGAPGGCGHHEIDSPIMGSTRHRLGQREDIGGRQHPFTGRSCSRSSPPNGIRADARLDRSSSCAVANLRGENREKIT